MSIHNPRDCPISREDCERLDVGDLLAHARARFTIPDGLIYLDGNSLGALPATAAARIGDVVRREWGEDLIASPKKNGWRHLPERLGARIARLIGAADENVIVADSTSINLFKIAATALQLRPERRVILTEAGNFPSDLYVLQGLRALVPERVDLRILPRERIAAALNHEVALLVLTHVHYKTGEILDMRALTRAAHDAGALAIWDLSHSAGALELTLDKHDVDFAVGCGYKFLNGGPGAPAFLYAGQRHQATSQPPLTGWMGHAAPFDFSDDYRPAPGMRRHLVGTHGILGLAALEEGLRTFDGIQMSAVREKSKALGDLFIGLIEQRCDAGVEIIGPRDSNTRGSQVSLRTGRGEELRDALATRRVICDYRAPDTLRFGFAPLYVRYVDIWDAVDRIAQLVRRAHRDLSV